MSKTRSIPYFVTRRKVNYWFNVLNNEVFGSRLLAFCDINIMENYNRVYAECLGIYHKDTPRSVLYIHYSFKNIQLFLTILAHEMVHSYQWKKYRTINHSKKEFLTPWFKKLQKVGIKLSHYVRG